ncbi:MAG: hypothetical protein IT164_10190 [Bryobacterales bacterium]|nr:hypothetical protein [Bryobacterales bacterium]
MKALLALLLALPLAAQRYSAAGERGFIELGDNEGMRVTISPEHGAELCGVKVLFREQWRQLIYRACDYTPTKAWAGRAPWLWPATARNFPADVPPAEDSAGSSYDYRGKRYPMPIHGFARDHAWKVESVHAGPASARAVLSLGDTAETRRFYPFGWRLEIEYTLAQRELLIEMRVRASNQNMDEMFFSAGNHITFRLPLVEGSNAAAVTLQSPSAIEYVKNGFMPTGAKRPYSLGRPAALATLPRAQAVTLGGYRGDAWMTLSDPAGLAVTITHQASSLPEEACLFNMWGDAAAGYFSPEPWVGLQNSLVSGKGLVMLKPGAEWTWRLRLSTLDLEAPAPRQVPAR